jgi:precorrin-2 dehydrogenase / sirohydrochlorin ferrochelatase
MTVAMAKYPIFLDLRGRRVVVIGGGLVALRKAEALVEAGARLVVVAKQTCGALSRLCTENPVELVRAKYAKDYLGPAALVIAATNDADVNKRIYDDCQELAILCNVVDQPQLCDFFVPAVVRRGDLQIAVGTEGFCPAYASHLRKKLEQIVTPEHGEFLAGLEATRKRLIKDVPEQATRKALLGQLVSDTSFQVFVDKGPAAWRRYANRLIKNLAESSVPAGGSGDAGDPAGLEALG